MTEFTPDRRKVLMSSAAALTIGMAGCLGDDDDDTDADDNGDDLEDWLADANAYDGEIVDFTGEELVEVENGTGPSDAYEFLPPAIRIDEGTTVRWVWVSSGHTVTHDNGNDFATEIEAEGFEFEHTFDEAGEYRYICEPHFAQGQIGAVVVE